MWGLAMGVHHGPFDGYGDGEHPLAGYAALIGLDNALFAAGLVLARRTGLRLPECLGPADVLLLGVGTFRLSRLLSKDSVTSSPRAPRHSVRGRDLRDDDSGRLAPLQQRAAQAEGGGPGVGKGHHRLGDAGDGPAGGAGGRGDHGRIGGCGARDGRRVREARARVALLARGPERLESARKDVEAAGGEAFPAGNRLDPLITA